jgi:hypothetical protein
VGDRQESFGKEPLLLCSFEYLYYYLSLLCGREPTLTPITWPIHLVFSMSVCSTWVRTEAEHHIGVSLSSLHQGPTLIISFLMVTMFDIIALFFLVLHIFKPRELDVKHVENLMGTYWEHQDPNGSKPRSTNYKQKKLKPKLNMPTKHDFTFCNVYYFLCKNGHFSNRGRKLCCCCKACNPS